jgi:ATP adenylyltransferase/5',5'''-P-1,P-4-tetraphosphate phosphorylase II
MQIEFPDNKLYLNDDDSLSGLPEKAERLFEHQLKNWKLASDGYRSLTAVQIKKFEFDNFTIEAHFNPGRIISSSAKVDAKSIEARPCFLCINNLPNEQKAVKVINDYILLVNPFPIFDKHFTIPSVNHVPQTIKSEIENLLTISSMLGESYSVFYNGPGCGASAPDHLHFQSGNFGFMKIDTEYKEMINTYGEVIFKNDELVTTVVTGCLRNFISLESNNISKLTDEFESIYNLLNKEQSDEEPMMNIICSYHSSWRLLVFPRSKHRPSYFFEEGENKLLISPAAVDLGGVLILPREEDFNKITKELIIDIFKQVILNDDEFSYLSDKLKNR